MKNVTLNVPSIKVLKAVAVFPSMNINRMSYKKRRPGIIIRKGPN
jgi:hypothetical protein